MNSTNNADETDRLANSRPAAKKDKQTWRQFIYDRRTGKVMNRSVGSWFQLLLFYVVFYALLAAFWAVMLAVFLQTLDDKYPKWHGRQSVMATDHGSGWGPGVSFQPQPSTDSTFIKLDSASGVANGRKKRETTPVRQGDPNAVTNPISPYVDKMREFLGKYNKPSVNATRMRCDANRPPGEELCDYSADLQAINLECNDRNNFGYNANTPCVFLSINKIYDWVPEPYAANELPKELDRYLSSQRISYKPDRIYFVCDGEDPVDQENIGAVKMMPQEGISANYFPYKNQKGYVPPIAAALFRNLRPNTVVNVVCRAFAKNIPYSADDRLGATKFEFLISS